MSSQKDSQADTVRSYLRQVSLTTPTLLPYVVNLTDGNGNMALHYCVSHSNFPVVKLLLDTGERPFATFRRVWNPASALAKLLVCAGLCETDNMNKAGYTPVMLAALTAADGADDLEVAQQLLKLGNVDTRSRQVITTLNPGFRSLPRGWRLSGMLYFRPGALDFDCTRTFICFHPLPSAPESFHSNSLHFSLALRRRARQRSCSQ